VAAVPIFGPLAYRYAVTWTAPTISSRKPCWRAWLTRIRFEPAPTMSAWLFTILRNHFRTNIASDVGRFEDADGGYAERLTSPEAQTGACRVRRSS